MVSKENLYAYISKSKIDATKLAVDLFCLLETLDGVAELSYSNPKLAYQTLLKQSGVSDFHFLRAAINEQIFRNQVGLKSKAKTCVTEKQIEQFFFKNLNRYISGACAIKRPPLKQNLIPDGFIKINGDVCPVEVKKGNFSNRALQQLLLYIHEYGAKHGVAVAGGDVTCKIPENVTLVRVNINEISGWYD